MPTAVNAQRIQAQLACVEQMIGDAPTPLVPVLRALATELDTARQDNSVPDRPFVRSLSGPGGNWLVSRFSLYGQPWAGLEWPTSVAGGSTIDWLRMTANRNGVSSQRPDLPSNQLWVHLGTK